MTENHPNAAKDTQTGNAAVTELVFILDASGSMSGLEESTIRGYNDFLAGQKELPGEAYVTTVVFNQDRDVIHDRVPITEVKPLTDRDYIPNGCTALLDAVGSTLHDIRYLHAHLRAGNCPGQTLFVITTDGLENASTHYTVKDVKEAIREQTEQQGWEFLFLGANIDAVAAAEDIGIRADRAANWHADECGISTAFRSFQGVASSLRAAAPLEASWRAEIDADFTGRRQKRRK